MKKKITVIALVLFASWAGEVRAAQLKWDGTLQVALGNFEPLSFRGSGVATVNGSGNGNQLAMLRLAGGIAGRATIQLTDPNITGTIPSIRVTPRLGTGTLSPFWPIESWPDPQLVRNVLPIRGTVRICLFDPSCASAQLLPLTEASGQNGVGVGGVLTVGGAGNIRISVVAHPWTVFTADLNVDTLDGGTTVWQQTGWIHGPSSFSSSAAQAGGALQLVTPIEIRGNTGLYLPGFSTLTLEFAPEPAGLLLLVSGFLALVALGSGGPR